MIWQLFERLAQNVSIIVTLAYVLSKTKLLTRLFEGKVNPAEKAVLILLFGGLGIAGTYTGIEVKGALANSRVVGVAVGGLLGGPLVGFAAGLLAGTQRALMGGFTAIACGIATTVEGTLAGYAGKLLRDKGLNWKSALVIGMSLETVQMILLLLIARPLAATWDLVKAIGLPMIIMNGIGISMFATIIQSSLREQERIGALMAQKALQIANQTLPILRKGLNENTAQQVAQIIYEQTEVAAVAFTDREKILAHVGEGADHHNPGHGIQTMATRKALETGELKLASSRSEIGCTKPACPLSSALIVPLKIENLIVGTLKLYHRRARGITPVEWQFGAGLGVLFSTQLELAAFESKSRLVARAELKALQAQINPHFLFNALNTVISFCRTDPEKARRLLIQLGEFFRKNLQKGGLVTLREELEHVHAYLAIEQARFGDRLKVSEHINENTLHTQLPRLTLQPLVENAIKHGIYPLNAEGEIRIHSEIDHDYVYVTVKDNGVGIPKERLEKLKAGVAVSTKGLGIGVQNVAQRLKYVYGCQAVFQIDSCRGQGTTVKLGVPLYGAALNLDELDEGEGMNASYSGR